MFVKFGKIEFNNFKTIRKGALFLEKRGVVMIQGINNDKGGSNGAGKSTIANGLLWCLFDRTLNGRETEVEVVPKFIKPKQLKNTNGTYVAVSFRRDGVQYRVTRYRKHPEHKNTVVVEKEDINGCYSDVSKCVDKESNTLIESIVGSDFHAFVHSNIFSFNNIEPFLERNDKDKKELVLPRYFVNITNASYKKCGIKIKETEEYLKVTGESILSCALKLSEKNLSLNDVEKDIEARDLNLKTTKEKLKTESKKKTELENSLKGYKEYVAICIKDIDKFRKDKKLCKETLAKWEDAVRRSWKLENIKATIERDINAKKLELEECSQNDKEIIVNKMVALSETVKSIEDQHNVVLTKLKTAKRELETKQNTLKCIRETKDTVECNLYQENQTVEKIAQQVATSEAEIKSLLKQKKTIIEKYYSEACKTCPSNKMDALFKDIESKIRELQVDEDSWKPGIKESYKDIKLLEESLKEVLALEKESLLAIEALREREVTPLGNEEFAISEKLNELKSDLHKMQSQVEGADAIVDKVSGINLVLCELTNRLGKTQLEAENLKKDQPVDNVEYFLRTKNKLELKIKAVEGEKQERLEIVNSCRVELGATETVIRLLEEALIVTDELEIRKEALDTEIQHNVSVKKASIASQTELEEKLDLLKFWKIGFSPAGIEGFMMDSLVNTMNSLIAKYLGHLSNNTMSLTIVPNKTLKSGSTRNKISEEVENDSGGNTYRTNSEGEKRLMDIAVLFSLKYIYEQITGTRYNILFCDEAFDTLDAATCSLVINLINSLDNIDSLFAISHVDSIALEFDNFVRIIKTKGVSEIIDEV